MMPRRVLVLPFFVVISFWSPFGGLYLVFELTGRLLFASPGLGLSHTECSLLALYRIAVCLVTLSRLAALPMGA